MLSTSQLFSRKKSTLEEVLENVEYLAAPVISHLETHIGDDGYMKASTTHSPYFASWFRDDALVSIFLGNFSKFLSDNGETRYSMKTRKMSASIIDFAWSCVEKYKRNLENGARGDITSGGFLALKNHFPARVGPEKNGFVLKNEKENINDSKETEKRSWLRQYDALALVLLATDSYMRKFGTDGLQKKTVESLKNCVTLAADYLINVYKTPCADAWEKDEHLIHSYTVSSIYAGLNSASDMMERLGLDGDAAGKIKERAEEVAEFLRDYFVRENKKTGKHLLYRAKEEFSKFGGFESDPIDQTDSQEMYVFSMFSPPTLSKNVETNTVRIIERERLYKSSANALPTRYHEDRYFKGGRWFPLGSALADILLDAGRIDDAETIIKYISQNTKNGMIPEQELVDPEIREDDYYIKKYDKPISCLAWSEAAYLNNIVNYYRKVLPGVVR